MKVLVIGGGGREDALVWKILKSPEVSKVYCAPGNGGILEKASIVPIKATELGDLLKFALKKKIDLTVVGPEEPLCNGIVDLFEANGLTIVGPSKKAAEIEGSKVFAKELMLKYGIPTATPFAIFTIPESAIKAARNHGAPIVVKADGLCAGKGVKVCQTEEEAVNFINDLMVKKIHGKAGEKVILEECLEGEEATYVAFTDGKIILPLASSQDHKPVFDEDQGPNTGGMGAYSPAPVVTKEVEERIIRYILKPAIDGMTDEGRPYRGILYAGLMIKNGDPYALEFNARFGDPETQPVLVRMKNDIVPILLACAKGDLSGHQIEWHEWPAVCVVMAAKGYPGTPEKWDKIEGLCSASLMDNVEIFHAGTLMITSDEFWTNGGRVLGVTGMGPDIPMAIERAYEAVERISWPGVHFRTDIGQKALSR